MAELSEEQLLLLDNLMYYSGSTGQNKTVKQIAEAMKAAASSGSVPNGTFSGGFEKATSNAMEIADAILADPKLCEMVSTGSFDTAGARATCFVNPQGEATIAVRGTGGTYDGWTDNFYGFYETETVVQKEFAEWVKTQAESYDNITITGHSKGGNLAQYATIVCGDAIDRCVSYDGQGFNDAFHEKYANEIEANKGKIKSISADGDYVNILLKSVAGETVYLEGASGTDAHSSYELWKRNQGTQINGEYSNTVDQSYVAKALNALEETLGNYLNTLPDYLQKAIINMIGNTVALFLSSDKPFNEKILRLMLNNMIAYLSLKYDKIKWMLPKELQRLIENFLNELNDLSEKSTHESKKSGGQNPSTSANNDFSVNVTRLKSNVSDMGKCNEILNECKRSIDNVRFYSDSRAIQAIALKIQKQKEEITSEYDSLKKISELLSDVADTYDAAEVRLVNI